MCVAIPHRVIGVHFTANGTSADIEVTGGVSKVDTSLLEEVKQGDYVLVFRGQALRVVSEEEAQQIQAALDCVQKVMDGGGESARIEDAFSDLVEHPAQLPDHLVSMVGKKVL